jgi:anti-anti-sigma regulatory factor
VNQSLFLQEIMPQLCKGFDVNLFESELRLIREIEKTFDPKKVFEEKLNIAASGDRHALAKYHSKLLSKKIGKINESINKLTEEQYNRINSELDQFKSVIIGILTPIYEHLKLIVNEQGTIQFDAAPAQVVDFSKLDAMGSAASGAMPSNWTIMGVLDKIGRALTGNYSALGIFQLVLDLLGLIPGYGIIFDILNALIYLYNGEYVLMALSLVAIIPGLGDAVALSAKSAVKPIAGSIQKIFGLAAKGDIPGATAVMNSTPGAKSFFKKYVRPVFAYVPKLISNGILKINDLARFLLGWTSYIPWVGPRVKGFFSYIESSVVKFKAWLDDVDSTLLKSLDEAEVLAKATLTKKEFLGVQRANSKILRGGGSVEYIDGAENVIFKSADGKVLAEVKAETFVDQKGLFGQKFPGASKTTTVATDVVQTQKRRKGRKLSQAEVKSTDSWIFTYSKTKSTPKLIKGLAGMTKNLFTWRTSVILGKYIYKYFTGGFAIPVKIEGTPVNILDEADYAYVSSAALTDYVQQTISARRKQTGEIYNPTVVFNSMDMEEKQGFDMTQSYLRDMARKTGQPSIIPVIYDKYKSEMDTELVGALDETFASLLQKEEEERLAKERGENVVVKSKDGDEIEIAGITIEEAYSRKNWTNPFSKFK